MGGDILFLVAAFAVINLSSTQVCNQTAQVQFVLELQEGLLCGLAFKQVNDTPSTIEGMMALDKICVEGCAGAVSWWLASTECNDTLQAAGLRYWCQPADNGRIPRCRYALDQVNPTIFNNTDIGGCLSPFSDTCPGTCGKGLQRMSEEIGCCYQNIYNDTVVLDGLELSGDITTMERQFFNALSNPALWNVCMVQIPDMCTSLPFPMSILQTVTTAAPLTTTTDGAVGVCFNISLVTTILLSLLALIF